MSVIAYIGLGSNMGDKLATCRRALELMSRAGRVVRVSSFYCTEPVGYPDQEPFLNAVAEFETDLSPLALLAACHVIEEELGRNRLFRWGPRTIDLDILLYGDQVVDTGELAIPHPQIAARRFVLTPLCEIAPVVVHPVLKKTVCNLLKDLIDPHKVVRCES
jgi:2-amino-4-hydroxy-6-hydroxymethyldihydropteridine diphosphokinase